MSSDLNGKSGVEQRLDDIYAEMVYSEYARNTQSMYGQNASDSYDNKKSWWDIENEKRKKIRYYYSNYSLKRLIIDFFLIIITSGLAIFFFMYRHKKHVEYRNKVKSGEWKEEDFMTDLDCIHNEMKDAKFINMDI